MHIIIGILSLLVSARPVFPATIRDTVLCVARFEAECSYSEPEPSDAVIVQVLRTVNANYKTCYKHPDINRLKQFMLPDEGNTTVVRTVHIPCRGVGVPGLKHSNGQVNPYDLKLKPCGTMEEIHLPLYYCVKEYGHEKWLQKVGAIGKGFPIIVFSMYRHPCWSSGMAVQNCLSMLESWSACFVLIRVLAQYSALTLAHEIGHVLNLGHSVVRNSLVSQMGFAGNADIGCLMGRPSGESTCFNAPHANALGWATSLGPPISRGESKTNMWMPFTIPIYTTAFKNHLIIKVPNTFVFVSLRSIRGGDGMDMVNDGRVSMDNSVLVHTVGPDISTPGMPYRMSYLEAVLKAGESWIYAPEKLAVKHKSFDGSSSSRSSQVLVCFFTDTPASCTTVEAFASAVPHWASSSSINVKSIEVVGGGDGSAAMAVATGDAYMTARIS